MQLAEVEHDLMNTEDVVRERICLSLADIQSAMIRGGHPNGEGRLCDFDDMLIAERIPSIVRSVLPEAVECTPCT